MSGNQSIAVLNNFYTFVESLADLSGAPLEKRGNTIWYNKGLAHPMYQYAVTDNLVEEDVAVMLNSFGSTPFFFCLAHKQEAEPMLKRMGLASYGELVGMFYNLNEDLPKPTTSIKCDIQAIACRKDYEEFARVMTDAAEIDSSIGSKFFNSYENYVNSPFQGLIAYINNKATGCVMLMKSDKPTAGIYYLWILPQYRKKGIGTALSARCLEIAKGLGYEQVVIQCMTTSASLHKKIGFQAVSQLGLYGR